MIFYPISTQRQDSWQWTVLIQWYFWCECSRGVERHSLCFPARHDVFSTRKETLGISEKIGENGGRANKKGEKLNSIDRENGRWWMELAYENIGRDLGKKFLQLIIDACTFIIQHWWFSVHCFAVFELLCLTGVPRCFDSISNCFVASASTPISWFISQGPSCCGLRLARALSDSECVYLRWLVISNLMMLSSSSFADVPKASWLRFLKFSLKNSSVKGLILIFQFLILIQTFKNSHEWHRSNGIDHRQKSEI